MTKRIALVALALSLPLAACGDDPDVITTDETTVIEAPDMDGAMDDMGDAVDGAVDGIEGAADDAGDTMGAAADDAAATMDEAGDEMEEEMTEVE